MKTMHLSTHRAAQTPLCLLSGLIAAVTLAGCGGNGDSANHQVSSNAAQQIRPAQKTSSLNQSYANVVQELYVSYFGRPADPTGLANFEAALAAANAPEDAQSLVLIYNSNSKVKALIDSFGTSKESTTLYGSGSTTAFVTAIFQNVLNRQPQSAGLNYWVSAIDSGALTRGNASLSIMAGALENTSAQGLIDAQLITNRIAAATTFTTDIQTAPELRGYAGAAAAQTARTLLAGVTNTTDLSAYGATINSTVESLSKYLIGGTLSGLGTGGSLTLNDNGGDALTLTANGTFQFATPLAIGASYDVTLSTSPIGQLCALSSAGPGQVVGDVNFIGLSCHFPYAYAINLSANTISQYDLLANGNLSVISPVSAPTGKSPTSITMDPGHQNVYVTNQSDGTVGQFTIGSGGALTPLVSGTVATGYEPSAIAITPNGKYAYVANSGTTSVSQYAVAANTGILAPLSTPSVTSGTSPSGIAIDPSSSFVWVINNGTKTISQFTITAGGGLNAISAPQPSTGINPLSITVTPNGKYVYVVNSSAGDNTVSQYSVQANGSLVAMSTAKVTVGTVPESILIDAAGANAYVVDSAGVIWQYSIGATGGLSKVASTNVSGASAIAIDPSGRFAYVSSTGGTVSQFTISANGGLVAMSPASVPSGLSTFGIVVGF